MIIFLAGLVIFFGIHSISIINVNWRDRTVDKIGEVPWKGMYSFVATIGIALMIWGYRSAQVNAIELYTPPTWFAYISFTLLLPVFPLLIAAYFPGKLKVKTRHPMLLATKLWAVAHLLANGSLINVLLFGSFLIWATVDRISLENRTPRSIPSAPPTSYNDIIAVVTGVGCYLVFVLWLHTWLIGIPPL